LIVKRFLFGRIHRIGIFDDRSAAFAPRARVDLLRLKKYQGINDGRRKSCFSGRSVSMKSYSMPTSRHNGE
jgi:hypothetical protein